MANTTEVKGRIKSIRDTMKITSAMYMISSMKLRKAKSAVARTAPYFFTLQKMIARMLYYAPDVHGKYFSPDKEDTNTDKRYSYLVISGDKGLAGAYNLNVLKLAQRELAQHSNANLMVVGEVGRQFFVSRNIPIDYHFQYTAESPTLPRARSIAANIMELFDRREIDEVYVIFTKMKNSMSSEAELLKLLPLDKSDYIYDGQHEDKVDYLNYDPSPQVVLDHVINDALVGLIYGTLVESYCSEQNSRMIAMQAANDSAKEMLRTLSLEYNRIRQSQITQELTEIVSGYKAQQRKRQQRLQQRKRAEEKIACPSDKGKES